MTPVSALRKKHRRLFKSLPKAARCRTVQGYSWAAELTLLSQEDGTDLSLELRLDDDRIRTDLDTPCISASFRVYHRTPQSLFPKFTLIPADGVWDTRQHVASAITVMGFNPELASTKAAQAMIKLAEDLYQATHATVRFAASKKAA